VQSPACRPGATAESVSCRKEVIQSVDRSAGAAFVSRQQTINHYSNRGLKLHSSTPPRVLLALGLRATS